MKRTLFFFFSIVLCLQALAQFDDEQAYDYIDRYKPLAIELMAESSIPASVKLAQALYSSHAGSSSLASHTNNHFGLLCSYDFVGEEYVYDEHGEKKCFRKYNTVAQSYRDHAHFMTNRSRYNRLFVLDISDYKAWAIGLQEAGYSTDPDYAQTLISIIEQYYLYLYDKEQRPLPAVKPEAIKKREERPMKIDTIIESGIEVLIMNPKKDSPVVEKKECPTVGEVQVVQEKKTVNAKVFKAKDFEYLPASFSYTTRPVYENNKVKFIIAKEGDTFAKIGKEIQISEAKVRSFNDVFDVSYNPEQGEVVYLQEKNKNSPAEYHTIVEGETMRYIAQKYAVLLEELYKRNGYSSEQFEVGNKICIACKK